MVWLTSPANVPNPVKPITSFEPPTGLAVTMLRLILFVDDFTLVLSRPSVVPSLLDDMVHGMEGDEWDTGRLTWLYHSGLIFRRSHPAGISRFSCHFNFTSVLAYPLAASRSRKTWYSKFMTLRGRFRIKLNWINVCLGELWSGWHKTHTGCLSNWKVLNRASLNLLFFKYTCSDRASLHDPSRCRIPNGKKSHIYWWTYWPLRRVPPPNSRWWNTKWPDPMTMKSDVAGFSTSTSESKMSLIYYHGRGMPSGSVDDSIPDLKKRIAKIGSTYTFGWLYACPNGPSTHPSHRRACVLQLPGREQGDRDWSEEDWGNGRICWWRIGGLFGTLENGASNFHRLSIYIPSQPWAAYS